jgi:outer membrane protein assembly factor BamB
MRKSFFSLFFLLLAGSGGTLMAASPAMFRGDAAHTGVYGPTGRQLAGMQWRFATGGDVISSPAIADGVVYIGSGNGKLYAIEERSGQQRWAYDAGVPIHSSPAVGGDTVYFVTRNGTLHALDRNGKSRWRVATGPDAPWPWGHESGDFFISSPVLAGDLVLFGGGDGVVYAIDARSGATRWKTATGERIRATPAVAEGGVFVGSARGRLYRFDLATGAKHWSYDTAGVGMDSSKFGFDRSTLQSSPAVANGVVYIGSRDGSFYAVDAKSGALRWKTDYGFPWVITSPAVTGGRVYIGSSDGLFIAAIDAESGKEAWRGNVGALVWSSLAVAGDVLVAGDGAGRINAFDRADGKQLWTFRAGTGGIYSSPVVDRDLVIAGSTDGAVYALRTSDTAVQRVVYLPKAQVEKAEEPEVGENAAFFVRRGYAQIDSDVVVQWLEARIGDRTPSVIVCPFDEPPDAALLRRYLDSGGKVVWLGIPPFVFPRDPKSGKRTSLGSLDFTAPRRLLGIGHEQAIFDQRGTTATAEGGRWGVTGRWRDNWGVARDQVTTALAVDEWGLVTTYVKSYGGAPGTGFVRVSPQENKLVMYWVAEYRPTER